MTYAQTHKMAQALIALEDMLYSDPIQDLYSVSSHIEDAIAELRIELGNRLTDEAVEAVRNPVEERVGG